jgi:pimeloyl-ACP methyl ester carboxylesterase
MIRSDQTIVGAHGRYFVRTWDPEDEPATAILLLHDSLGSVELWRDFPEQLGAATGRIVIAYDRLGYGKSDPNPDLPADNVVESESETVAQLLDDLDIERFIAFGHSIGGEMALACASRLGERCAGVIAESAQYWLEDTTLAAIRAGRAQFDDPEQLGRLKKYHGDKAQWVLDAWAATWLRPSMRGWSILPELPRVTCPLLLIHGDNDGFTSVEQPRKAAELAGGPVQVEILAGCGHIPHREQPEVVLGLVAEFLSTVD